MATLVELTSIAQVDATFEIFLYLGLRWYLIGQHALSPPYQHFAGEISPSFQSDGLNFKRKIRKLSTENDQNQNSATRLKNVLLAKLL